MMKKGSGSLFLLAVMCAAAPLALAQTLSYDVASVKPHKDGSADSALSTRNGQLAGINVTVRSIIRDAYQIQDSQIVDVPAWADSDRFDVIAKSAEQVSKEQGRVMMQSLLAERFNLVVHRDTREMAVYRLRMARPDGKPGPGLRRADCAQRAQGACNTSNTVNTVLHAEGISLDLLAQKLSSITTRVVVQDTGLDGPFDIDLAWSRTPSSDTTQPSIFTAVQEQLGLKLEPARGQVDVLVIDRVEPPTPD